MIANSSPGSDRLQRRRHPGRWTRHRVLVSLLNQLHGHPRHHGKGDFAGDSRPPGRASDHFLKKASCGSPHYPGSGFHKQQQVIPPGEDLQHKAGPREMPPSPSRVAPFPRDLAHPAASAESDNRSSGPSSRLLASANTPRGRRGRDHHEEEEMVVEILVTNARG